VGGKYAQEKDGKLSPEILTYLCTLVFAKVGRYLGSYVATYFSNVSAITLCDTLPCGAARPSRQIAAAQSRYGGS
jgi:hypothetical protein